MPDSENTQPKRRGEHLAAFQFQPGNPGRPKGSRNKLGEEFVKALLADWSEHGAQAVRDMREKSPGDYVRVIASILPKDINFRVGDLEDLTDDELAGELAGIAAQLAGEGRGAFARIAEALSEPRGSA